MVRGALFLIGILLAAGPAAFARAGLDDGPSRGVTVRRGHVYLGELLEELSRQMGAEIRLADQEAPAGGVPLAVFVRDLDPGRVLEAMADHLSTPTCRWEWRSERQGRRWLLAPGGDPVASGRRLAAEAEREWLDDLRRLRDRGSGGALELDTTHAGQVLAMLTPQQFQDLVDGKVREVALPRVPSFVAAWGPQARAARSAAVRIYRDERSICSFLLLKLEGYGEIGLLSANAWQKEWLARGPGGWKLGSDHVARGRHWSSAPEPEPLPPASFVDHLRRAAAGARGFIIGIQNRAHPEASISGNLRYRWPVMSLAAMIRTTDMHWKWSGSGENLILARSAHQASLAAEAYRLLGECGEEYHRTQRDRLEAAARGSRVGLRIEPWTAPPVWAHLNHCRDAVG